ncbi:MAG: tRNA dihydrouridine synthase DusB [bacterium]|jgi:tRNA-dihydrouridine synthase B|nr:tRNA dihydrouridine synthase DusB [bacterium]MBK9775606.1 tRNA dihydrouridine synthase DusB [bacterium]
METALPRKQTRLDPRLPWLGGVRRLLSPMAGVTDRAFREICRRYGADMGFCEFASASGLTYGGENTWKLVDTDGEEGLVGVQIFGADPEHMAQAARLLSTRRLDVLDINFGCPVKKVVQKCGGSALLADVPLLERIIRAVIDNSGVPVTAKIRTGWDEDKVNYDEVGLLLQEVGCSWVTMHGRTRAQKFSGQANWDRIAHLVEVLDIPVIGNGDVVDGASYRAMVAHTGCHGVMIGRGAMGNPWIFEQMRAVDEGVEARDITFAEMCAVTADHVRGEVAARGEGHGCLVVRSHITRCFRGYPGASAFRRRLFEAEGAAALIALLAEAAGQDDPRTTDGDQVAS